MRYKSIGILAALVLFVTPVFSQETVGSDSLLVEKFRYYDEPIDPDIYLIRPGEKLIITFLKAKVPEFWLQVNPEGRIVEKNLGVFKLAGKTLSEVRQILHDPLKKLYNVEEFEVSIREPYKVAVMVTGQVESPGMYVGYTSMRVSEIIKLAGGVKAQGSSRNIVFASKNNQLVVDLDRVRYSGSNLFNPCLYAGDRIVVPTRSQKTVTIIGEVLQPRTIELLPGDGLKELIVLAGGFSNMADSESIYVISDPQRDLSQPGNIFPDDVIVVPALTDKSKQLKIFGAVNKPGQYLYHNKMTLQELLSMAGGVQGNANKSRIVIFRKSQNSYWRGSEQNVYPITAGAGSFTELENTGLIKGDSVFVPVRQGFVKVSGWVQQPGSFPYKTEKTVQYYLGLAGGFTINADKEQIRITDNISGTTFQASLNTLVRDSDEIVVPREEMQ